MLSAVHKNPRKLRTESEIRTRSEGSEQNKRSWHSFACLLMLREEAEYRNAHVRGGRSKTHSKPIPTSSKTNDIDGVSAVVMLAYSGQTIFMFEVLSVVFNTNSYSMLYFLLY